MNRSGLKLMCFKSEDLKTLSIFFFHTTSSSELSISL